MQMFDTVSGIKQGLTFKTNYVDEYENKYIKNCMMYLNRVGAQLQIVCYKNGKMSHIVCSSYVLENVMETWNNIKADLKLMNRKGDK